MKLVDKVDVCRLRFQMLVQNKTDVQICGKTNDKLLNWRGWILNYWSLRTPSFSLCCLVLLSLNWLWFLSRSSLTEAESDYSDYRFCFFHHDVLSLVHFLPPPGFTAITGLISFHFAFNDPWLWAGFILTEYLWGTSEALRFRLWCFHDCLTGSSISFYKLWDDCWRFNRLNWFIFTPVSWTFH